MRRSSSEANVLRCCARGRGLDSQSRQVHFDEGKMQKHRVLTFMCTVHVKEHRVDKTDPESPAMRRASYSCRGFVP